MSGVFKFLNLLNLKNVNRRQLQRKLWSMLLSIQKWQRWTVLELTFARHLAFVWFFYFTSVFLAENYMDQYVVIVEMVFYVDGAVGSVKKVLSFKKLNLSTHHWNRVWIFWIHAKIDSKVNLLRLISLKCQHIFDHATIDFMLTVRNLNYSSKHSLFFYFASTMCKQSTVSWS